MPTSKKKDRRLQAPQQTETANTPSGFRTAVYRRSGILPPPNELDRYEEYCPGVTKILLDSYVKQQEHRISLEKEVIHGDNHRATVGQYMACFISTMIISFGFVLVLKGKDGAGFALIIGSIATLAGTFLYGVRSRRKERQKKSSQ